MMIEEWGEFFLGIPEEAKKWFAFPNLGRGTARRDPAPN